jgi:hypothetical protein
LIKFRKGLVKSENVPPFNMCAPPIGTAKECSVPVQVSVFRQQIRRAAGPICRDQEYLDPILGGGKRHKIR